MAIFNDDNVIKVLDNLNKAKKKKLNEARMVRDINYPDIEVIVKVDNREDLDSDNIQTFEVLVENIIDYDGYYVVEFSFEYRDDEVVIGMNFNDYFNDLDNFNEQEALEVVNEFINELDKFLKRDWGVSYREIYHSWE